MPFLSDDELAELQRQAADDALGKAADAAAAAAAAERAPAPPPEPEHRAVLADGSTYDYAGAHPTHVATPDGPVLPVIAVHPIGGTS